MFASPVRSLSETLRKGQFHKLTNDMEWKIDMVSDGTEGYGLRMFCRRKRPVGNTKKRDDSFLESFLDFEVCEEYYGKAERRQAQNAGSDWRLKVMFTAAAR